MINSIENRQLIINRMSFIEDDDVMRQILDLLLDTFLTEGKIEDVDKLFAPLGIKMVVSKDE